MKTDGATTVAMADPAEPFVRVLHPDVLRALTDSPSWERGENYFREGRVGALARSGGTIKATVSGSTDYEVRIWVKGDQLAYSCTCPSADKGFFCKHCVAVALAWLTPLAHAADAGDNSESPIESAVGRKAPAPERAADKPASEPAATTASPWSPGRMHAQLRRRDPAELADLLLDLAEGHPAIRDRLRQFANEG